MEIKEGTGSPITSDLNHGTGPTTLFFADIEQQKVTGTGQTQGVENPLVGLPIYLLRDKNIIQPLNVPARNAIAHKSPTLLKVAVTEAFQRRANKNGSYKDEDCVVHWKPSAIPFHIEFEISSSGSTCQHLASVRNITASDVDQFARNLAPLAKLFLSKPPGSHLPHLPFTQPQIQKDNQADRNAEDKKTTETVQHARLINNQHKCLTEIDIETAEATARMVNADKILSSLLVYLTSSKHRAEGSVESKEPQKTEDKRNQSPKRPTSSTSKRLKVPAAMHELQGLEPTLQHKRVVSNPDNDVEGVMATADPARGGNGISEDMSTMPNFLPDESNAKSGSSKGGKASKKNKSGKKKRVKEKTRCKAISAVSAYPTQRPPRKKRAKKCITNKEPLQKQQSGPEEHDSGQVQIPRPSILEGSDVDDHKENAPEPLLTQEESLQRDFASPESSSEGHEESMFHTPEESLDQERIAADVGLPSSDILDEEKSFKSSSDGDEESRYYTPEEGLESEEIPSETGLLSTSSLHEEDLVNTTDEAIALHPPTPVPTQPRLTYGGGARGLLWAYATNTDVDEALIQAGVWLWNRPKRYFCPQRLLRNERFEYSALAPVIVSHERTDNDEPIIHFDGDTVHIVPHEQHWEDLRSYECHPDFLGSRKLAEYQACEAAGYEIWRHDRDLLRCRKPSCGTTVSDYNRSVVLCLGCGPKSIVRYCSLQHQLEDLRGHWKECGTWKMVLKRVIDHATAPSKFARMFPAIKQRHGSRTAALHRQRHYCALTSGHYTLFRPGSHNSKTLCWPKQSLEWQEMDRRIERLLNIAFLDSWNHVILGYLYRLLCELLRSEGVWFENTERLLKKQFESEFSNYKVNTHWKNGDTPCQCEWSGKILPRWDHLSTCWAYAPVEDNHGPLRHGRCIRDTVEDYEARFWILRAWRQQHPGQNNWRLKAAGYGFPNTIPDEECYNLGAGWTGWGGEEDNICEDQLDQGERDRVSMKWL